MPSVPGERGTATTERAGLQPGQLVAAARTAEQDQELVADELATQVDEDRRSAGQARVVLLAAAGRRAFEPQAVRRHAAQDLGAAAAKRVALTGRGATVFGSKMFRKEQCRPERRSARSINVCERMDEPWRLPAEVMCRVQREKTWYSGQRGCILSPCQGQNGNPGLGARTARLKLDFAEHRGAASILPRPCRGPTWVPQRLRTDQRRRRLRSMGVF